MFTLNPKSTSPLVVQIVEGFRDLIQSGNLRPGSKAPSIRQFAHAHGVSVYTVVDAYDRLVALGFKAASGQSYKRIVILTPEEQARLDRTRK